MTESAGSCGAGSNPTPNGHAGSPGDKCTGATFFAFALGLVCDSSHGSRGRDCHSSGSWSDAYVVMPLTSNPAPDTRINLSAEFRASAFVIENMCHSQSRAGRCLNRPPSTIGTVFRSSLALCPNADCGRSDRQPPNIAARPAIAPVGLMQAEDQQDH